MVVTIAASLVLTVLGVAVGYAASGLRRSGGDHEPDPGPHGDERDREIDRTGSRAAMAVIGVGYFATTVLAMADADTFWIGNTLFVLGAVSALVETGVKIRLYRRGW